MSMPGQFDPPPPRSGGSPVLKIVLIILAVLIIGCGGLCAGCLVIVNRAGPELIEGVSTFELMIAQDEAIKAVRTNEAVIERLGEPVVRDEDDGSGFLYKRQDTGKLKPNGETLQFVIKGPKGNGTVTVLAKLESEGVYLPTNIAVMFEDSSSIDVPPLVEPSWKKLIRNKGE